jgi:methylase of polypeptide subunit release factors
LISNLTNKNDLILDNFVGSGTTLVESKIPGRRAIGVDINPLACLVAKVKITSIQKADLKRISAVCMSIKEDILKLRANREYNNNNTSTFNLQDPQSIDNNNYLMAK